MPTLHFGPIHFTLPSLEVRQRLKEFSSLATPLTRYPPDNELDRATTVPVGHMTLTNQGERMEDVLATSINRATRTISWEHWHQLGSDRDISEDPLVTTKVGDEWIMWEEPSEKISIGSRIWIWDGFRSWKAVVIGYNGIDKVNVHVRVHIAEDYAPYTGSIVLVKYDETYLLDLLPSENAASVEVDAVVLVPISCFDFGIWTTDAMVRDLIDKAPEDPVQRPHYAMIVRRPIRSWDKAPRYVAVVTPAPFTSVNAPTLTAAMAATAAAAAANAANAQSAAAADTETNAASTTTTDDIAHSL